MSSATPRATETPGTPLIRIDSVGLPYREDTTISDGTVATALRLERRFDNRGRTTGVVYPGGRELAHDRDASGRLRAINHITDGTRYPGAADDPRTIAAYTYAGSRVRAVTFGNGTAATLAHDARGGVVDLQHTSPTGAIFV